MRREQKAKGMLIGVLDSGFDGVDSALAFAPLRDRGGILLTRDMVTHDGDVYQDHWHGRSVLSCMAGYLEGQLLGTAPEADFVLLRTEEVNSEFPVEEDHWVAGAELADSLGCDVLNTSLGYTTFDDSTMDTRMRIWMGRHCGSASLPGSLHERHDPGAKRWEQRAKRLALHQCAR
ncbi:MAG: S8 family serine peptidase [Flavobacteriales bacterium]|nr:S8 family serine peptidase [Flavobacteriales bacterium]